MVLKPLIRNFIEVLGLFFIVKRVAGEFCHCTMRSIAAKIYTSRFLSVVLLDKHQDH